MRTYVGTLTGKTRLCTVNPGTRQLVKSISCTPSIDAETLALAAGSILATTCNPRQKETTKVCSITSTTLPYMETICLRHAGIWCLADYIKSDRVMLRHNFLCNGTYLCFSICQDMHPCPSPEPPESCSSAAPPRLTVPFLHLHIAALSRLLSLILGSSHPFMRLSNLPWQPKLPIVSSSLAGWCRAPDWVRRAPLPPDSSTEQLQIHRTVRSLPVSGGSSNTVELHHTRHLTKASSQPKNPCPALRRVLAICKNDNVQLLSIESFAVACTKQLGMPAKGHKHWVIYIAHDLVQCETSPKHAARHPVPAEPAALFGCCTYMACPGGGGG